METKQIIATQAWRELGLKDGEYRRIVDLIGRDPNWTELGMFAVLWSEHCAYKHSRPLLKQLPTEGPQILVGPGENAGVVDVGDYAVAFKMESHNHPSAIEPYQGAATGAGGIIRDILSMGARPVALLDSLRFGSLDDAKVRYLFDGVVAGIAGYGNCVGIPTVGGEVYFEESYTGNPLVNVMCVGVLDKDRLARGMATGSGNTLMVLGAGTGRDGIHGATFASDELNEGSEERRPAVQVGDPFTEKLLIEACLELVEQGLIVGIQDMGAAGLTSSLAETASRAGSGVDVDLDQVPLREADMTPYEIMLSESQERMLLIVAAGRETEVETVCRRWGVQAARVGTVRDDGMLRLRRNGRVVADIPARALTDDAPVCHVESRRPAYLDEVQQQDLGSLPEPDDWNAVLENLLAAPNIASKEWVYSQYDYQVRTNTVQVPGWDAAVIRLRGSRKALALATDGNGRYGYLDPYLGGALAVAESARNVVCSGARPLAVTNCLNFGNPEKPEVYWQLEQAIAGMAAACRALGTPVTGGNVSLYNETYGTPIYPTPIIGMVGVLADAGQAIPGGFATPGHVVVQLGATREELGGSQYLQTIHQQVAGCPPQLHLNLEVGVQRVCLEAMQAGWVSAAHDCSDGGLAVALAEGCILGGLGLQAELASNGISKPALLFGESASRILVAVPASRVDELTKLATDAGVPWGVIGVIGGDVLTLMVDGQEVCRRQVADLARVWRTAIARRMDGRLQPEEPVGAGKGAN